LLGLSWQGRLTGMAVAWALAAAAALWLMVREGWVARAPSAACARDALRYGVPLLPHALGALLLGMADRFLVTNLMDVGSTGVYVVAVQIGMVLGIAADAFNRAFAPWLMETLQQAGQERKQRIVQYTYFYFGVILAVAAVGTVVAPYLLGALVGPRYQAVAPIVGYILFGNAFMGMYYMVTNYVFIARRTELLSGLSIVVGAATTALNWYLITHRGLSGAAQAFMFGQALLFLGTWVIANYCYQMPWLHAVRQFKQA
jgi:O-antigen/teichoic acid export membrane protein